MFCPVLMKIIDNRILIFIKYWNYDFSTGLTLALAVAMVVALPNARQRRDSFPGLFELPSNASLILGGINTGFDCVNLPYGYYADEANNCAIFHVCLPYIDHDTYITRMFSFMCGQGSVFDQVSRYWRVTTAQKNA